MIRPAQAALQCISGRRRHAGVSQLWESMPSELMIFYRVAVESHSPGLASVGSPTLGISAKARTLKEFYSALPLRYLRHTPMMRPPIMREMAIEIGAERIRECSTN